MTSPWSRVVIMKEIQRVLSCVLDLQHFVAETRTVLVMIYLWYSGRADRPQWVY